MKKNNIFLSPYLALSFFFVTSTFAGEIEYKKAEEPPVLPELSLTTMWDSRYVSEGRDNLDGESLLGTDITIGYKGFSLSNWFAFTPESPGDYQEYNLGLQYALEIAGFTLSASYTYLHFPEEGEDDNEVGFGIAYDKCPLGISYALVWYYSFDAEGVFIEANLSRGYEVASWLIITPSVVLGFNEGYITEGHDSTNYVALSLSAAIPLSDNIELSGYLSYNWSIDSDSSAYADDALLKDFFHGGISLSFSF